MQYAARSTSVNVLRDTIGIQMIRAWLTVSFPLLFKQYGVYVTSSCISQGVRPTVLHQSSPPPPPQISFCLIAAV